MGTMCKMSLSSKEINMSQKKKMQKQHRREMREQREGRKLRPLFDKPEVKECEDCGGTGECTIPARQEGGQIVDEQTTLCHCRAKVEDEMDDDS